VELVEQALGELVVQAKQVLQAELVVLVVLERKVEQAVLVV
jgi:hypothetical protein